MTSLEIQTARHFEHVTLKNADGTPIRARRNGKTQFWKTRPGDFRLPAKHGLKDCFNITPSNVGEWNAV
jgi:hypothetical protein